ncbi:MAG: glycosyltransferase [Thaumarchaeota archaeon]|nr:glycosyltransferase [Nitrososphaerota archaeon]
MSSMLSIIIPSLNEGKNVEMTINNIKSTIDIDDYEIIVADCGGTDLSSVSSMKDVFIYRSKQGAPQSRNFGAEHAHGDILLFADGHVKFQKGWAQQILNSCKNTAGIVAPCLTAMSDGEARGCGFEWTDLQMNINWLPDLKQEIHEIPFAGAGCMAIQKKVFFDIGEFDSGLRLWGSEDSELSLRTWLLGYQVVCDPSIRVGHLFRETHPYHISSFNELYNIIRLGIAHFSVKRLEKFLYANSESPLFLEALLEVQKDGILARRKHLFTTRTRSDDWFFEKFKMAEWD